MTRLTALLFGLLYGMSIRFTYEDVYLRSLTSSVESHRIRHKAQFTNHHQSQALLVEDTTLKPQYSSNTTGAAATSSPMDYEFRSDEFVLAIIDENTYAEKPHGDASTTKSVQRLIQSARTHGKWEGPIALITESEQAYASLVEQDPLVHLLDPNNDNKEEAFSDLPKFNHDQMKLARHKTLLLDYIIGDPRMKQAQFVLYIDTDFIITQPLVPWLSQKWNQGATNRQLFYANLSSLYMFHKKGPAGSSNSSSSSRSAHTGLILMHKHLSYGCLQKWASLIPRYRQVAADDEWLIRMIISSPGPMRCKVRLWESNQGELLFSQSANLDEEVKRGLPHFVKIAVGEKIEI